MSVNFANKFAAKLYDGGGNFYDVNHPTFGAVGDGSTNDATAIQAAITAAASTSGTVRFQPGATYKVNTMLQGKPGVNLIGGSGSSGSPTDNSRILWGGAGGGTMLNFGNPDNNGQNLQNTSVRNLTFYGAASGTVNASRPAHAITFSKNADTTTNKLDFFSVIERCSFQRFGSDAIQYNGGATNLHISDCRWDHISGYAVYVDCKNGTWLGSISRVTWDTGSETETTPNGFLMLDGQATLVDTTGHSRFALENARLEVNKALTSNLGVIGLGVAPGTFTNGVQHYLSCDTVSFDFASSVIAAANYVVAIVGGPSDGVDITMENVNTQFPDSVLGYCNGLTSTWCAPNPTSSNKYHPTRWTCRPNISSSPGSIQSRPIYGERMEIRASLILGGDGGADANTGATRGAVCLAPCSAAPGTPPTNYLTLYNLAGVLKQKDSSGTVKTVTVA